MRRQCIAHTDAPAAALLLQAHPFPNPAGAWIVRQQNPAQRPAARDYATPFARAALVPPFSIAASKHLLVVRHAARDGAGEVILIVTQERGIVLIVDKRQLNEDGGLVGVLEDVEPAPVLESPVRRAQSVHNLALDALPELSAARAAGVHASLRAVCLAIKGIAVDRHKDIRIALVGRAYDCIKTVVLQIADDLDTCRDKVMPHEIGDALCHVALSEAAAASPWIGIAVWCMTRIQKYFHFNG